MDICGFCGHNKADAENDLCNSCGEDFQIKREDFEKAGLRDYILNACSNLDICFDDLRQIIFDNDQELYDKLLKKVDKQIRV